MPKSAESFGKHMKLLNSLLESLYHITFLPATYVRSILTRGCLASSPGFFSSQPVQGEAELRAVHGKNCVLLPPLSNPKTFMAVHKWTHPTMRNGRNSSICMGDIGHGDARVCEHACARVVRAELSTGSRLEYVSLSATSGCLCPGSWFSHRAWAPISCSLPTPHICP